MPTSTLKHPYRYLPPLPSRSKSSETAKKPAAFGGRSGSPLPSSSDVYSSTSYSSVAYSVSSTSSDYLLKSPLLLLISHLSGRRPDQHPRTHQRHCCLAPRPSRVRIYPLQTSSSPHFRPSISPCPALLPPLTRLSQIPPLPQLSRPWAVVAWPPSVARPLAVDFHPSAWPSSSQGT